MKSIKTILIIILVLFGIMTAAQNEIIETSFKVFGNCNECKDRIEEAMDIEEVKFVKWDKNSKNLKLAYSNAISLDSLKQRIASVGHDTEDFSAPDSIYSELPSCCKFRDNGTTH